MFTHRFPNAETIIEYISRHPSLNYDYYKERGIAPLVAKYAAEHFANSCKSETDLKMEVLFLIIDLKVGPEGIILHNEAAWMALSHSITQALRDCTATHMFKLIKEVKNVPSTLPGRY